jgi:hypothetical protein
VDEELWIGKISGVMRESPEDEVSEEYLVEATGLTATQIERAVNWQNQRARRWHERFGKGRGAAALIRPLARVGPSSSAASLGAAG